MTRRSPGTGRASGAQKSTLVASESAIAPKSTTGTFEPWTRPQWIVLEDFPSPEIARTLSPNGRAHFGTVIRAKKSVRERIVAAVHVQEPFPVAPPARVLYRWIVPDNRRRDLDNHGTGVVKVIQDSLVKLGVLPGGDHSEALTSRVEIVVQKYRRAMEICLEPVSAGRPPRARDDEGGA